MGPRMLGWAAVTALAACGRLGFGASADGSDGSDGSDGVVDGSPGTIDAAPGAADAAAGGPDAGPAIAHNLAFVTSSTHLPNFGGVAAADALCQTRASDAGLGGTFAALLGDSSRSPLALLAGSRGWTDVTGTPIADLPTDWLDGHMVNPLRLDEAGAPAPAKVWLGDATFNCQDWTSALFGDTGRWVASARVVNNAASSSCNQAQALICVQLGDATPLTVPVESGRVAFITDEGWLPGAGGVASADAQCASEAAAAGLPGTYLAWLSTSTSAGFDRFDLGGLPWRRVDGVRLTSTAAEFAAQTPGGRLRTFLNRTATGATLTTTAVHTGAPGDNCDDWTNVGAAGGAAGYVVSSNVDEFWDTASLTCGFSMPLLCLQE